MRTWERARWGRFAPGTNVPGPLFPALFSLSHARDHPHRWPGGIVCDIRSILRSEILATNSDFVPRGHHDRHLSWASSGIADNLRMYTVDLSMHPVLNRPFPHGLSSNG